MKKLILFLTLFIIIIISNNLKSQAKDDYLNLVSNGDCQYQFKNDYTIESINFKIEHTGIFSKKVINKIKFRLTIWNTTQTEIIFSKIYSKDVFLNPYDVDYIKLYINKEFTEKVGCDYCTYYTVEYLPVE